VNNPIDRREFLSLAAGSAIGLVAAETGIAQSTGAARVPLGLDGLILCLDMGKGILYNSFEFGMRDTGSNTHAQPTAVRIVSEMKTIDLGHTDLASLVYKRVKNLILKKELRPGQKIVQEELASQLGVSRTPLIKAIQRLEAEFLVESIPRRGMFVKEISAEELIDAFECREALEGVSARRAATVITDAEISRLHALFTPFQGREGQIDPAQYVDADIQFHKLINDISGNQIIARLEILGNIHRTTVLN
jgi:DNA-binding GntR family transcriptional regulator